MATIITPTSPPITASMLYDLVGRCSLCPAGGLLGQMVFGVNPVSEGGKEWASSFSLGKPSGRGKVAPPGGSQNLDFQKNP
jgi:hypothetical protein